MNLFYEIYMNAHVNVTFPDEPDEDDGSIDHDPISGEYHVRLPRRGRLSDTRIFNQNGEPDNIGPTPEGAQWQSIEQALTHFRRIAVAIDRMNQEMI